MREDGASSCRAVPLPFASHLDIVGTILALSVPLVYDVHEIRSATTERKEPHFGCFTGLFASDRVPGHQWSAPCYHSTTAKRECPIVGPGVLFCDSPERDNHEL